MAYCQTDIHPKVNKTTNYARVQMKEIFSIPLFFFVIDINIDKYLNYMGSLPLLRPRLAGFRSRLELFSAKRGKMEWLHR
jgi:hypothetical protein